MDKLRTILFLSCFLLALPVAFANTYIADMDFTTSSTVFIRNETIGLKGSLYFSNYTDNGTVVFNSTGIQGEFVNLSIINKNTGEILTIYGLNTSSSGHFYSKSDFYTSETAIYAPITEGYYYIRANYSVNYTDSNDTEWWTQLEIQVVNQTVDKLDVSSDKVSYGSGETMVISAEAIDIVGDRITYVSNVSISGNIRDSSKTSVRSFSCTTGSTGKCSVTTTAPSSYGDYYIEINNYKAFSSFEVKMFDVNILMKDSVGKSIKHRFDTGEQASVEVGVITNSTTDTYNFEGVIKNNLGVIVKNITSTELNSNNSYVNRFTSTLDAINFQPGSYSVEVNVTKAGDGTITVYTSFELRTWSMLLKKSEINSGFEYEYSTYPNKDVNLEIYPSWSGNGSIITGINDTTDINITLSDKMSNQLNTIKAAWNSTCSTEGCYKFNLTTPSTAGEYYISVIVSYNGEIQSIKKKINVITGSISAQSTDERGTLKELFSANDNAYITLSATNSSSGSYNLTDASIISVIYMNGSGYNYVQVNSFDLVNTTNSNLEWAWNSTLQRMKLDTPSAGGLYTVYISGDNNTAATSAKFLVNPYDLCMVAKNTAGQAGGATGYYYVYQFKTTDTIYFELKVTQATNPAGRASFLNSTNSSYGMGTACGDESSTKQAVNNATITIEEVFNTQTGRRFSLNNTNSGCQSDDSKGGYTCTVSSDESWDGGSYSVKLKIIGQDGKSDIAYGMFEARAFYLYAWSNNWRNQPTSSIVLNVYMYEAGDNWWGSYGSGGLDGTVEITKVEYQGNEGEWLSTPIDYGYNVSAMNSSTITNGQGTLTLSANNTPSREWKTGSYRAILKGIDNGGNVDYGYAWFSIKRWEVYASPVDCTGNSCSSVYNINSKSNISLYVTINNAGEWGQSGNSLGGNVTVSVKKINDCRKWPCTELNSSKYNSTGITVDTSSGWYWGTINGNYLLNITPVDGTWGTGYWQIVLDVNDTETGTGWFNTIAFYVEAQPTDVNGANWRYSIKNNEPMYFKVTTVQTQKNGYYYKSYNAADYLNTTIDNAFLRRWDQTTQNQVEYNYPNDFNISVVGAGTVINGTRILNLTYNSGNWPSGYYWGELVLKNNQNETAVGNLWFQARPFRVEISSSQYSIDNNVCVNGTINIYEPDWGNNNVLNGTYNITSVSERVWTMSGSTVTTYTNYTPSGTFNGTSAYSICYTGARWGSGSWGNYHYLDIKVVDSDGNSENGWLSFRTIPFSVSWGSIFGGTNVQKASNIVVPVTITKASSGANTTGNLSKIYQWRTDSSSYSSNKEEYVFSVGNCFSNVSGNCMVNGTQNVTIYVPSGGWKDGYNYLQAEWFDSSDSNSRVEDWSGIWFNGMDVYNGYWDNVDGNGNWRYDFAVDQNITIRLNVRDSSNNPTTVNLTKVEYSVSSNSCWSESCRTYNNATYSIAGNPQSNRTIAQNAILIIHKPSSNWTKAYITIKATVSGPSGTSTIKNGQVYVKDLTAPVITVTAPITGDFISSSSFWVNWTTTESSTCYVYLLNHATFNSWYCSSSWYNISNQDYCNTTTYSGSSYYYEYVSNNYRSWNKGKTWDWSSGITGLVTGGLNHRYQFSTDNITDQDYGIHVYCNDEDWNYAYGWAAITINLTNTATNVTLIYPTNTLSISLSSVTFNYTLAGPSSANCSLYGNNTGSWTVNATQNNLSPGANNFTSSWIDGNYLWNIYCVDVANSSNYDWGDQNWTFNNNYTS